MNFEKRYKVLKEIIESYKKAGFHQIRFPGGTSFDGKKNSIVLIAIFDDFNHLFFVVVPYDSSINKNHKNDEKENDEKEINERYLAIKKVREETGLIAISSDLQLLMKIIIPDNRGNGENHEKFFFLLEKFSGKLIDKGNSFLNVETKTPLVIPAPLLAKFLFRGHFLSFEKALEVLSSKIKKEYRDLILLEIKNRDILDQKKQNKILNNK